MDPDIVYKNCNQCGLPGDHTCDACGSDGLEDARMCEALVAEPGHKYCNEVLMMTVLATDKTQ